MCYMVVNIWSLNKITGIRLRLYHLHQEKDMLFSEMLKSTSVKYYEIRAANRYQIVELGV